MRKYINGEGWHMEIIEEELYFVCSNFQWNYNIDDLIITHRADRNIIYIECKNTHILILKVCFSKEIFPTWLRITLHPKIREYFKIKEFFTTYYE